MKILFAKERVFSGVQRAISIMPSKTGAAALRSLWIKAEDNAITISSTDANIEFTGTYAAEVNEPGFIGVQGQIFQGLIATCTGMIEMSMKEGDGAVKIKHKSGVCKLPVMSLNWFEEMKPFPDTSPIVWSGDMIKEVIEKISFAISDDNSVLDALSCLYFTRNGPKVDICGLNGHLFAKYAIIHDEFYNALPENGGLLVQKTYLPQINKWLGNDEIDLAFNDQSIFFRNQNGERLTVPRVNDREYPNYTAFLERLTTGYSTLTVNKGEFIRALNRISTVNTDADSCTDLNISEDNKFIDCSANIENTGEVLEKISITYDGSIRKISFRTKNLISVLEHFDSNEITLKLTTEVGPCGFYGDDDPFYEVVLMPVQTLEKTYIDEN